MPTQTRILLRGAGDDAASAPPSPTSGTDPEQHGAVVAPHVVRSAGDGAEDDPRDCDADAPNADAPMPPSATSGAAAEDRDAVLAAHAVRSAEEGKGIRARPNSMPPSNKDSHGITAPPHHDSLPTGLVLPSTEVAGKPHADKIPPPLSVPSTWRGRLHLRDQIALARQLEFGKNLATQDALRRLLAPFFPAPDIPAVQVPPHVFGGHSNWEDVIDCLLFFFSLDAKLQEEHLQAATSSRSKWYKKNIDVLCENRPTSYHIVMRFFPPSPGDEIIAAVRSKNTPSLAKLEAKWDARLQQLKKFKEQHGHCNVPSKHPGGLGHWASNQRSKKKSRRLDAGRTQKLEELGFQWEMLKIQPWEVRFQQLKEFKAEHGHCNIPKKHPGGLGQWVNYQRTMKKSQHLDAVRTQKLEELGFQWEATKSQPWENLDEGEPAPSDDAAETGRSPPAATRQGAIVGKRPEKRRHVPRRFKRNADDGEPAPSSVVAKQDRQWESQLRKLKEFKEEHGHCNVPSKRLGGLGRWVRKQRTEKKSQRLDDSRIQKLEELGFRWDGRLGWYERQSERWEAC